MRAVVEHFSVRLTVALGSVPMAVPHTRPVMLTNHGTRPELLMQENVWKGRIRIPASALAVTELRLGEWGHDAMGFVAHIPHYVAQLDYPLASTKLLEAVEVVTGLEWDTEPLRVAGEERMVEIAAQIEDSPRCATWCTASSSSTTPSTAPTATRLPLAEETELPTGEELGAEFERFLGRSRPPRRVEDPIAQLS